MLDDRELIDGTTNGVPLKGVVNFVENEVIVLIVRVVATTEGVLDVCCSQNVQSKLDKLLHTVDAVLVVLSKVVVAAGGSGSAGRDSKDVEASVVVKVTVDRSELVEVDEVVEV